MSSLLGHLSAGVTVYLASAHSKQGLDRTKLVLLVLLAIAPDFDYIAIWLLHTHWQVRGTHSLLFGLITAVAARAAYNRSTRPKYATPFLPFAVAAFSHPFLDLLVGAHSVPLFWPLSFSEVSFPVGLLPSAGTPAIKNYYFWRNLAIEVAVLFPIYAAIIAFKRKGMRQALRKYAAALLPIWLGFLLWSINIH